MKQYAIFDCDDVLCNTSEIFKKGIEEILGHSILPVDEWYTWHFEEMFPGLKFNDLKCWIQDNNILNNLPLNKNAAYVVEEIKRKGFRTAIVTARSYLPNASQITKQWVKTNDLPIDSVFCVSPKINKSEFIATLPRPVHFFIDDHYDHIIGCQEQQVVKYPILLTRPWNKSAKVKHRINELDQIVSFVEHFE